MTIIGLLLQAAAVPLIITGHFGWALVVGLVASLCDALDGAVARAGVGPTKAGAFLDSTLDRVSELMVGAALVIYFVREGPDWAPITAVLVFMSAAQLVCTPAPAPRRSAWTARSGSCLGRSAWSASASAFSSRGGSRAAPASSSGCCTYWRRPPLRPWCTASCTCCASCGPRSRPPALEAPPAPPGDDLPRAHHYADDFADDLGPSPAAAPATVPERRARGRGFTRVIYFRALS